MLFDKIKKYLLKHDENYLLYKEKYFEEKKENNENCDSINKTINNIEKNINKLSDDLKDEIEENRDKIDKFCKFIEESLIKIKKEYNAKNYNPIVKTIDKIKYSLIFEDTVKSSKGLKDKNFSLNNNASNYSFMYLLYRILNETHPRNILELGLGQTTKMTSQYAKYYKLNLKAIKDNKDGIEHFSKVLTISRNVKIIQSDVELFTSENSDNLRYTYSFNKNKKFDLILTDGPFGGKLGEERKPREYPRSNIWNLMDNLCEEFVIIIDDYNRTGEQNMALKLFKLLESRGITYYKKIYKGLISFSSLF